jgi:hypothetical protein
MNTDRTITGPISLVRLCLLQLAIVAISSTVFAQEIAKPKVVHEVLLTHQDDVINPWAVTKSNDGGFVIAGSAGLSAWATKIDGAGNVAWNYVRGLQDNFRGLAEFRGAVAMLDGTTYLCGWMPRPPGSQAPAAMLTQLDAAGRLISEKFMAAQGISDGGVFADCVRWGDGIAVVGQIGRLVRPAAQGVYPVSERAYRLLTLDAAGNVRWDVQISTGVRFGAFTVGAVIDDGRFEPSIFSDRQPQFRSGARKRKRRGAEAKADFWRIPTDSPRRLRQRYAALGAICAQGAGCPQHSHAQQ